MHFTTTTNTNTIDPHSHTLVLIQRTAKPSSRSYLECNSVLQAANEIIDLFENKLKLEQNNITTAYTNFDVLSFIKSMHEFACLVKEQVTPTTFAYVSKEAGWIKPYIDTVLHQKIQAASSLVNVNPRTSTLCSRLSMPPTSNPKSKQLYKNNNTPAKLKQHPQAPKILIAASKVFKRQRKPVSIPVSKRTELFTAAYAQRKNIVQAVPLSSEISVQSNNGQGYRKRR